MVDVNFSLVGSNGDTIEFDNDNFVLNPGMLGFGIAPTQVRVDASAGAGGTFRNSKRGVRKVDLPVTVLGSSRTEVESKLRRLARLLQDSSGATKLYANYSDGASLYLDVHYTGGADSSWGEEAGMEWCEWVISVVAPNPFWESAVSESFTIRTGNIGRGLLPQLSKLKVSSSSSLGTVTVVSSADVDVYPVWTVTGPIADFTASNGLQSFTLSGLLEAGQTIFIDTEAGTVTDDSGANAYSLLAPAPKLFPIRPGTTTIEVTGTESTLDTRIVCEYALRYEVVH